MSVFWRLYWASVATWLTFWSVVGGFNAFRQWQLSGEFIKASKLQDHGMVAAIGSVSDMHASWVSTALLMAVFWTIPAMIAFAFGRVIFSALNRTHK